MSDAASGDHVAALAAAVRVIPYRLNPHAEAATRQLDRWVAEHGLISRPAARERFDRARFAWFAALTYPTASEPDLALVADWFAWLFLLDDQLDDGRLGRDPDRTGVVLGAIGAVLLGRPVPAGAPPLVTALDELWGRTLPLAGPSWRRRFLEHMAAGGAAAGWEAGNRVRGTIPDERSYVENRRHTGAIYVCMDLIEIVERIDVPPPVYAGEPFATVLRAACDVVCWTNDLYSLDKENSLGEFHNLVTVVHHAGGLDRDAAAGEVVDRIIARLHVYFTLEPVALATAGAHTAEVSAYLAGMRSWMRGNLDWSASTRRYRDRLPDNGDYLEPDLVDGTAAGEVRRWQNPPPS